MHLPKFNYFRPDSLQEAIDLLNKYSPSVRLVAGGTELFPRMKYGLEHPDTLISLRAIQAHAPCLAPNGDLVLDALMTLTQLARSPEVEEKAPLLAEATLAVGANEIRNMGTLGGNLCQETRCLYYNQTHQFQFVGPCFKRGGDLCYFAPKGKKCWAVFMSDTAPALVSLGAKVRIEASTGPKQILLEDLYTGEAKSPIGIDQSEILSQVLIPKAKKLQGSTYSKFTLRGGLEFGAVVVASVLEMEDDLQTCAEAHLVVGAATAAPVRAIKAESMLRGKGLTKDLLNDVAQMVRNEVPVIPHHGFSKTYLKECLRIQTSHVLHTAAERVKAV